MLIAKKTVCWFSHLWPLKTKLNQNESFARMCRKFCAITSSFAARPGNVETPVWPDLRPTTFTLASFKKIYQLFFQITLRNILLRFSFPHSFIQRQIPLFLDTLQWPLSNSCHPSPVKYVLISFGKAFPRMTRPSNQLRIIFFQIWHRAPGAIMIMQKEKRNQTFVLWQRVFHNQFDLPNKRIRLSKWFDERCLIERQWGIEKVNTCVQ